MSKHQIGCKITNFQCETGNYIRLFVRDFVFFNNDGADDGHDGLRNRWVGHWSDRLDGAKVACISRFPRVQSRR